MHPWKRSHHRKSFIQLAAILIFCLTLALSAWAWSVPMSTPKPFAAALSRRSQKAATTMAKRSALALEKFSTQAEEAFANGERLRLKGQKEAKYQALRDYEKAIVYWQNAGNLPNIVAALNTRGEVLQTLGELQAAFAAYSRARLLNRSSPDTKLEIAALNGCGYVSLYLGERHKALDYLTQALTLSRTVGDAAGEAESLANLGEYYHFERDPKQALEYQKLSLALHQKLQNRRGEAHNLLNLCRLYSSLNDTEKSFAYEAKALALWQLLGDSRGASLTRIASAGMHMKMGDKQKALDLYTTTLKTIQWSGDKLWEACIYAGLGYVYKEFGDAEKSLAYNRKALARYQEIGVRPALPLLLIKIGEHFQALGEFQTALSYYAQAQKMNHLLEDKLVDALWKQNLGRIYEQQGQRDQALQYFTEALALSRQCEKLQYEAYMHNSLGNFYFHGHHFEKARDCFQAALTINQQVNDQFGKVETLYYLARLYRDHAEAALAQHYIGEALRLSESLRDNLKGPEHRTSFFATVQKSFDLYIDLLMQQQGQNEAAGFAQQALEWSERARARTLLESLLEANVDIRRGVDATLVQREGELKRQLDEQAKLREQLLVKPHTENQLAAMNADFNERLADYEQTRAQIRAASPNYSTIIFTQPIQLKEIQGLLNADTVLLEYRLGEPRSYLWLVTAEEVKSFVLPARVTIEKDALQVFTACAAPDATAFAGRHANSAKLHHAAADERAAAARLSAILLGPVAAFIKGKRLLIVGDGMLQSLPFAVLPVPHTAANSTPLMVEHEIINLPSAAVLAALRKEFGARPPAPNSIAVFADPIFTRADVQRSLKNKAHKPPVAGAAQSRGGTSTTRQQPFERLPFSREEAEMILQLVNDGKALKAVEFDASLAKVKSLSLQQYRYLHFATHGIANSENPYLSGIVLSLFDEQGNPQDGFLRLQDISTLKLAAELVVLSACQTAIGKAFRGEGIISLTRGFMQAGSKRVLASLWKVNDAVTADLMAAFYRGILVERKSPAAALRQAQIKIWQQPSKRAPYYWAAFVLEGEWQ
ncbi:MAG: CHAT domain-containing protein [Acidobacteria bacterium]|nr:CHAT domain-containing protein [Acidobacteriota bacterium]